MTEIMTLYMAPTATCTKMHIERCWSRCVYNTYIHYMCVCVRVCLHVCLHVCVCAQLGIHAILCTYMCSTIRRLYL